MHWAGGYRTKEKSSDVKRYNLVDSSLTKDFLLVDGVLSVGAARYGPALEAVKGLMEDLLPVGRPQREDGEVVIGAPLTLLLPPPGGEL
jgi:hypothetical protein